MALRALVTGSSRGIGLGVCAAYAERGDHVLAVCRAATDELRALDVQIVDGIELTSDESVAKLPDAIGPDGLDVLVCNAAVNVDPLVMGIPGIDVEAIAHTLDVNATGVVRTVLACLPSLGEGSKIMLVGIGGNALNMGKHLTGSHSYGYRMAKAALTSFGFALAGDLKERGIAVVISSPGPVQTAMLKRSTDANVTTHRYEDAPDAFTVGRMFRDRLDELALADSPSWQRRPDGELVQFTLD